MAVFRPRKEETPEYKDEKVEAEKVIGDVDPVNIGEPQEVQTTPLIEQVANMTDLQYRVLIIELLMEIIQNLKIEKK
jgi:hypothetical protein